MVVSDFESESVELLEAGLVSDWKLPYKVYRITSKDNQLPLAIREGRVYPQPLGEEEILALRDETNGHPENPPQSQSQVSRLDHLGPIGAQFHEVLTPAEAERILSSYREAVLLKNDNEPIE